MSRAGHAPLQRTELRPTSGLVERALRLLASGPVRTERLAEEVLALRGNPSAAAAAVFALLGADTRVRVDGSGVWSLAPGAAAPPPGAALLCDQPWAVVDVETTGGSVDHGHRVIEIGIVAVAGGRIVGRYSTLINPRRRIPGMITSLTGISNEMVEGAPAFEEIAANVARELDGRVFVAHNATFDWRFVSAETERALGRALDGRRLCTLRIARRLLPHLPSRSLGALASYFGIEMAAHHRALEDAEATAHLLLRLLEALQERGVTDWPALDGFFGARTPRRRRSALPRSTDSA